MFCSVHLFTSLAIKKRLAMRFPALQNAKNILTSEIRGIVLGFLFCPHAHLASVFYTGAPKRKSPRIAQAWIFRLAVIKLAFCKKNIRGWLPRPAIVRRVLASPTAVLYPARGKRQKMRIFAANRSCTCSHRGFSDSLCASLPHICRVFPPGFGIGGCGGFSLAFCLFTS